MNSKIKRPQRGGDFTGAQGPHRVSPAKASPERRTVHFRARRLAVTAVVIATLSYHGSSSSSHIYLSLSLFPFFLPLFFFFPYSIPEENKMSGTKRLATPPDDHQ